MNGIKISPQLSLAYKIILAILPLFATAASSAPQYFGGPHVSALIAYWTTFTAGILGTIGTIVGTGAVPSQTIAGKVAGLILAGAIGLSLWGSPGSAEAASRKLDACQKLDPSTPCTRLAAAHGPVGKLPIPIPNPFESGWLISNANVDINKLIATFQTVSLADLQAAKADADSTKDTLASACYGPLISLVQAQQSIDVSKLPTVHVITTFQQARDLINALRPGAPVQVGCAPLANEVKLDVTTFVGQVAGGTLAIGSLAIGL